MTAITPTGSLEPLIDVINTAHAACIVATHNAIEHAVRAGFALLQAKQSVEHGKWLGWVSKNCRFGVRTAQRYMQLAEYTLLPNATRASFSSIRQALAEAGESNPLARLSRWCNQVQRLQRIVDRLITRFQAQIDASNDVAVLVTIERRLLCFQNRIVALNLQARRAAWRVVEQLSDQLEIPPDSVWKFVHSRAVAAQEVENA